MVASGLTWPQAMGVIVWEGLMITLLVLTGFREMVMDAIPLDLKKAIGVGIGAFIAFIGLKNAGIVVNHDEIVKFVFGRPRPASLLRARTRRC